MHSPAEHFPVGIVSLAIRNGTELTFDPAFNEYLEAMQKDVHDKPSNYCYTGKREDLLAEFRAVRLFKRDVNQLTKGTGRSLLQIAAARADVDMMAMIVSEGADVNVLDKVGFEENK